MRCTENYEYAHYMLYNNINRTHHASDFYAQPGGTFLLMGYFTYQILLAMKYLRLSDEEWTVFVNAFDKLIQNNNGVVSLAAMNLPADWKEHPPFTYDCTIRT